MVGSSQSAASSVSLLARCEKPHLDLRPELYTIASSLLCCYISSAMRSHPGWHLI